MEALKNTMIAWMRNPFFWIYILGMIMVYWTLEAVALGIRYDLVSWAHPIREMNDHYFTWKRGRLSLGDLIIKFWEVILSPLLIYILLAGVIFGAGFYFFKTNKVARKKVFNVLKSLKLAVVIVLAIALLSAIGTFIESKYADASAAGKLVYHSWWMYGVLLVLSVQLIAVMVDRWPWKMRHTGFILAHLGILATIYGSILTRYFGIDASMAIPIGEKSRHLIMPSTDIKVLSTFDGERYSQLYYDRVDFYSSKPTEKSPYEVKFSDKTMEVIDFLPYAIRESKLVESSDSNDRAAIRYQLESTRANVSKWIQLTRRMPVTRQPFGPMTITLTESPHEKFSGGNELMFFPVDSKKLGYKVYSDRLKRVIKEGTAQVGDLFEIGFMDFKVRVINYFQNSMEKVTYREMKHKSDLTNEAIKVRYNGKEQWTGSNSLLRFFDEDRMFVLTYGNTYMPIDVEIRMLDFRVGRYQGTNRAATYESDVAVNYIQPRYVEGPPEFSNISKVNISMNEPLKYANFTFYQASFQEDEKGQPTTSILSVNNDPGRFLKYLGSLLITIGSIWLFYLKKWGTRKKTLTA